MALQVQLGNRKVHTELSGPPLLKAPLGRLTDFSCFFLNEMDSYCYFVIQMAVVVG